MFRAERKQIKINSANERAEYRKTLTNKQQIQRLKDRGHGHCKEVDRLKKDE